MPSILKKEFGKVDQFFKKNVARPVNKFFKKGGQAEQAVRGTADLLGRGANLVGSGLKVANNIVNTAANSPYGAALAPALGVARGILGSAGAITNIAKEGSGVLRGLASAKGAKQITQSTLEAAKRMEKDSNKINFA